MVKRKPMSGMMLLQSSSKRLEWMNANLSKTSSLLGVMSRCVCNRSRDSSLSLSMLQIAVAVLYNWLNVRSGSEVVTGKVATFIVELLCSEEGRHDKLVK